MNEDNKTTHNPKHPDCSHITFTMHMTPESTICIQGRPDSVAAFYEMFLLLHQAQPGKEQGPKMLTFEQLLNEMFKEGMQ